MFRNRRSSSGTSCPPVRKASEGRNPTFPQNLSREQPRACAIFNGKTFHIYVPGRMCAKRALLIPIAHSAATRLTNKVLHARARKQKLKQFHAAHSPARAFPSVLAPDVQTRLHTRVAHTLRQGRLALVKGIRRLFLTSRWHGGGSVKHLFREFFRNSLWDQRKDYKEVSQRETLNHIVPITSDSHEAWQRRKFLPAELQSLREMLCGLISEESCAEWLGFNDLAHPDAKPPVRSLAGLIRDPDWTDTDNITQVAYVPALLPFRLPTVRMSSNWETPRIP